MVEESTTIPPLGERCSRVSPAETLEVVQSSTVLHARARKKVALPYCPARVALGKRTTLVLIRCQYGSSAAALIMATSLVAVPDSTSVMSQRTSTKSALIGKQAPWASKSSQSLPERLQRTWGPLSVGGVKSTTNVVLFEAVWPETLVAFTVAV